MPKNALIVSEADHESLAMLLDPARNHFPVREDYLIALEGELARARVVSAEKVPPDVVTMNSVVRLRDLDGNDVEEFELVYPMEADMDQNRISVLAPIGAAILGYRVGDTIEWKVPAGVRRLRIEKVLYQPEREGVFQAQSR